MKIKNQVVSLELAKELKENDYPQEGLWWWSREVGKNGLANKWVVATTIQLGAIETKIVAPTVAELGEKLPEKIEINRCWKYTEHYIFKCYKNEKFWIIEYQRENDNNYILTNASVADNIEANARAKMWLCLKKEL